MSQETYIKGNLLAGKRGLIMGVANQMSLGWGIAKAAHAQGAELAFSYQGEMLLKRIEPLAQSVDSQILVECDATNSEHLDNLFAEIEKIWGKLDFVIHAIAFSNKDELKGRYVDTTQENFLNTMNISCYTLAAISKRADKLMNYGGSIITLSYYGAEKAIPNYNVMGVAKAALESSVKYIAQDLGPKGIRVNTISAGPVKTLAAAGISDFRSMLKYNEQVSPLRHNTTLEEVGGAAVYLLSDLSKGTTGEVIHVDSGFHAIGLAIPQEEATSS